MSSSILSHDIEIFHCDVSLYEGDPAPEVWCEELVFEKDIADYVFTWTSLCIYS